MPVDLLADRKPRDLLADIPPAAEQPSTLSDMAQGALSGLRTGVESLAGSVGDINHLTSEGISWLAGKLGASADTQAGIEKYGRFLSPSGLMPTSQEINNVGNQAFGAPYQAQTVPGQYANTIGQFAPAAAMPGSIPMRAANALAPALASETAGQLTKGTAAEPYARIIASLFGTGAVAAAPRVARTAADVAGGLTGVGNEGRANRAIVTALTRSGKSPQEIDAALSQAAAEGQPMFTVADALGNSGQRMLSGVARAPGAGREAVNAAMETRQAGQGRRIASQLDQAFKGEGTAAQNAAAVNDTARVVNASPYAKAYEEGDKAIWSPELERLSGSPSVQSAMNGAVSVWADNAIADGYGAMTPGALVENGGILKMLHGKVPAFPNLQFWDYTKRILDNEIGAAVRTGADSKVRTLTALKSNIVKELDKAAPAYAKARGTAKGFFDIQDAIAAGTNAAKRGRTEDTTQLFNGLNPEQQQGFRSGYVDPLIEQTQGAAHGVNKARPLINDATAVEFPAFAGPQNGPRLQRQLSRENTMFETRNAALGGSKTADNLADMADVNPSALVDMVKHPIASGARHLVGAVANAATGRNEATRALIADALLRRLPLSAPMRGFPGNQVMQPQIGVATRAAIAALLARRLPAPPISQ